MIDRRDSPFEQWPLQWPGICSLVAVQDDAVPFAKARPVLPQGTLDNVDGTAALVPAGDAQVWQNGQTLLLLRQVHQPQGGKPVAMAIVVRRAQVRRPDASRPRNEENARKYACSHLSRAVESCSQ